MPKTIRLSDDLPAIRQYLASRIRKQAQSDQPISAIEIGFRLCEAGLVTVHFDVRENHERDGEWTESLNGKTLELPHWSDAYMQAADGGASFVLVNGRTVTIKPGENDRDVAGVFGKTLLSIARDAVRAGDLGSLPLREDCTLEVLEFDGMWEWPANEDDLGRTNLLNKLDADPTLRRWNAK